MTQEQKTQLETAIALARKYGHKVNFTGTCKTTGQTVYFVKSHSQKNLYHPLYVENGRIICDCHRHVVDHKICSHAAAVRTFLLAQRETLESIEATERKEAAQSVEPRKDHDVANSPLGADCYNGNHGDCLRPGCPCECHQPKHKCDMCGTLTTHMHEGQPRCEECQGIAERYDARKAQNCTRMAGHWNSERPFSYFATER